jgi:hypothetical protein
MKKSDMTAQQPQLDLGKTTSITTESGGEIFKQGFVLRKVSRFITGGDDAVLPIPVFYDGETGKIYSETLPPELREEYDTF